MDQEGDDQSHVITIVQEIKLMKQSMQNLPKILNESAGRSSCCIFRVPQSLVEINKEAYQPRIVSIGPYHHGSKDLEMIQEHKWRFLNDFLSRTGKSLDHFLHIILDMEPRIRQCYSESIDHFSSNDLAKMMVLDGFFIIELFRKVGKLVVVKPDDPIFTMAWVGPFLMRDLLRLENQIPFFVLKKLFDESKTSSETDNSLPKSLPMLILEFFNYVVDRPKSVLEKYSENLEGEHLLDFFRKSFIKSQRNTNSSGSGGGKEEPKSPNPKLIQPATKLEVVGLKFKPNHKAESFLDIEFRNGMLMIPQINMDDFYSSFFLNCVAFEQCYGHCSKDITTYIVFMGCLINNSTDAGFLSEKKIIENYFGTDKELAKFFNNVRKDVVFDIKNNYLVKLFMDVNEYSMNGWHVGWAGFMHTYFISPWAFISALAAFVLLSLAVIQTLFTVYPYYHPRN